MPHYSEKILYIIGGVNGVGKSSFINQTFDVSKIGILNPDTIAYELHGDYSSRANIKAARQVIETLKEWPKSEKPLIWESVLEGRITKRVIEDFKRYDYKIDLTYMFLVDENSHINRIDKRVQNGGHDIPKDDITKRFNNRFNAFEKIMPSVDSWKMICNQANWRELVAFGQKNHDINISNKELYEVFKNPEKYEELKSIIKVQSGFVIKASR